MLVKRIAVFCGGSKGVRDVYASAARAAGQIIASRGLTLVYGGGHIGLMGVLADAALAEGGEVVGVMPRLLVEREVAHSGLTKLEVVGDMLERKARMAALADAFIALPGGYGTLDELFEMLTWTQIGTQTKPCGVLNVAGYYNPLLAWVEKAVTEGMVRPGHEKLLLTGTDIGALLDGLASWTYEDVPLK